METVLKLTIPCRLRIHWERIIRGCLALTMLCMLYWGVQNYAEYSVAEPEESAAKAQRREAISAVPMVSEDSFGHNLKSMTGLPDLEAADLPVILPAAVIESPVNKIMITDKDNTSDGNSISNTKPKENNRSTIVKDRMEDDAPLPDIDSAMTENPPIEKTDPGSSSIDNDSPIIDEDSPIVDTDSSNTKTDTEISTTREFLGFTVDEEGYITGITENIDTTDGILVIAWNPECTGIRKGALSEVADYLEEIYIPANICDIEPGTFEELSSMIYIEVAEDNPYYYSSNGVLYSR